MCPYSIKRKLKKKEVSHGQGEIIKEHEKQGYVKREPKNAETL